MKNETSNFQIGRFLIEQRSFIALIILIAIVSMINPDFFSVDNILNILRQTSVNAIIAVGMTFVILIAGIDLSVGSVLALTGAIAASMVSIELPIFLVIPVVLLIGTLLGGISGVIVAKGKVQAFIATLVTMTLLRGITMVYTDGRPITTGFSDNADLFASIGTGYVLGIPVPIWMWGSDNICIRKKKKNWRKKLAGAPVCGALAFLGGKFMQKWKMVGIGGKWSKIGFYFA